MKNPTMLHRFNKIFTDRSCTHIYLFRYIIDYVARPRDITTHGMKRSRVHLGTYSPTVKVRNSSDSTRR